MALDMGDAPPPETLVELWPVSQPYQLAWIQLDKARRFAVGMSAAFPLGLEYSEVVAYAKENGFTDPEDLHDFVHFVYVIDDKYLAFARRKKNG